MISQIGQYIKKRIGIFYSFLISQFYLIYFLFYFLKNEFNNFMDSNSATVIEDLNLFVFNRFQYKFQTLRVGSRNIPYLAILRIPRGKCDKDHINTPSNYISFPLFGWSKFTQILNQVTKLSEIAQKINCDQSNNFQVLHHFVFHESDLTQFRIQLVRAGPAHSVSINLIKFYKNHKAENEFKPSRKFLTIPILLWKDFLKQISNCNSNIEKSFSFEENIESKANLTFAPKKNNARKRNASPISPTKSSMPGYQFIPLHLIFKKFIKSFLNFVK